MPILVLLLIVIPAVEIYLFIEIGGAIGSGWTFVLIILTALWGASAMRHQGLGVLNDIQRQQMQGQVPMVALAHGVLILLAGLLLLIPGFFTDFLGFFLMWRWARAVIMETVISAILPSVLRGFQMRQAQHPANGNNENGRAPPQADAIEGEFTVHEEGDK